MEITTNEKKRKKHPDKGHYGYIDSAKKKALIMSIISLLSVLIIFFTGVIIYKTNKSLFSVIAAVAALPAAKLLTGYIVLIPYKTGDLGLYKHLTDISGKNNEYKAVIGADFVISSPDKAMNINFAYIINGKVLCYTKHSKTNVKETEKYLKDIFDKDSCQYSQIKVFDDETKFLKMVEAVFGEVGKEYTDKRIFEKLCTYSM